MASLSNQSARTCSSWSMAARSWTRWRTRPRCPPRAIRLRGRRRQRPRVRARRRELPQRRLLHPRQQWLRVRHRMDHREVWKHRRLVRRHQGGWPASLHLALSSLRLLHRQRYGLDPKATRPGLISDSGGRKKIQTGPIRNQFISYQI
jgi:hypothetical protein